MIDLSRLSLAWHNQFTRLPSEQQDKWLKQRETALTDHMYLGTVVMGMDFQEMPHRALFNHFLAKRAGVPLSDLDSHYKKRMTLWSRGTFKTSGIVVDIVQNILNYPDSRTCFMAGGKELSQRQFERITRTFTRPTNTFKSLFPEFCEKPIRDTKKEFVVASRKNNTFPEPTLCTSTAKSVKAGSHFDFIYIDDLVNETNYRSIDALERCYQDYLDLTPLLDPTGYMSVTGTRYSFGDTYERIQKSAEIEMKETGRTIWSFSVKTCWIENNNGSRDVLFPQTRTRDGRLIGHTVEWLEAERIRVGDEFFACQYENCPVSKDRKPFPAELIARQSLFSIELIPSPLEAPTFFVGDLSYVGDELRDNSVIDAVRLKLGQLFVFDCVYGKWDSESIGTNLCAFAWKYRPWIIYLERFNGWEAYDRILQSVARDRGMTRLPLEWRKISQAPKAKLRRIGAVKTPLSEGRLWLFAGMPGYDELCRELDRFPKSGRRDDHADTLGHVCEVPSGYEAMPKQAQQSMLRKLHPLASQAQDGYDDGGAGSGIICQ